VLDTNTAEAALAGRFEAISRTLEWGNHDRPWAPSDFGGRANRDTAAQIAEFAVRHGVHAVLSPSHLLEQEGAWFDIDRNLCVALRSALDVAGGRDIAIAYHLMIPYICLLKEGQRRMLAARITDLPVENIWIRTANFGRDATPSGLKSLWRDCMTFMRSGDRSSPTVWAALLALVQPPLEALARWRTGLPREKDLIRAAGNVRPVPGPRSLTAALPGGSIFHRWIDCSGRARLNCCFVHTDEDLPPL
jgi:hypothetical protein